MLKIDIRSEALADYNTISFLTYEAFMTLDYEGRQRMDEHFLVHLLRNSKSVISELSFVAEVDGKIVGHILYTKSKVVCEDGTEKDTITFGPLSVDPKFHKQGVGAALVAHSMHEAKSLGYKAVLIEGVPAYYPKIGFHRAREYGLVMEDGTSEDVFMAYELEEGYLTGGGKAFFLAPEYVLCEEDDEGYLAFHQNFMKEFFPVEIVLRPFWDGDVTLMKRWLKEHHVAKWYLEPEDWLIELKERRDKYSFIKHFIVEFEGASIGFCQYYDCYFAKEHEEWKDEWHVGDREGEDYSIDLLIGEAEYLHKGFGKEIIRQLTEKIRDLGAKRIVAEPEQENFPSRKSFEANGYQYDGDGYILQLK